MLQSWTKMSQKTVKDPLIKSNQGWCILAFLQLHSQIQGERGLLFHVILIKIVD